MKNLSVLFVFALAGLACRKTKNEAYQSSAAGKVAGTRHWTNGKYHFMIAANPPESGIINKALNDTTFAIKFVNDTTISVWGTTLGYSRSDSSFYGQSFYRVRVTTDSIFFSYDHHISAAASERTSYSSSIQ